MGGTQPLRPEADSSCRMTNGWISPCDGPRCADVGGRIERRVGGQDGRGGVPFGGNRVGRRWAPCLLQAFRPRRKSVASDGGGQAYTSRDERSGPGRLNRTRSAVRFAAHPSFVRCYPWTILAIEEGR